MRTEAKMEYMQRWYEAHPSKVKEYHDNAKEAFHNLSPEEKEVCREKRRQYYQEHKEHIKECHHKWLQANKERVRAYGRKYREEHNEAVRKREREHYHRNKERIGKQQLEYRRRNRDRINARCLEYYHANKEKISVKARARYERNKDKYNARSRWYYHKNKLTPRFIYRKCKVGAKRRNITFHITKDDFIHWHNAQPKVCCYCDLPEKHVPTMPYIPGHLKSRLTIDRKYNDVGYEIDNIVLACGSCNMHHINPITYDDMKNVIGPSIIRPKWEKLVKELLVTNPTAQHQ